MRFIPREFKPRCAYRCTFTPCRTDWCGEVVVVDAEGDHMVFRTSGLTTGRPPPDALFEQVAADLDDADLALLVEAARVWAGPPVEGTRYNPTWIVSCLGRRNALRAQLRDVEDDLEPVRSSVRKG